MATRRVVLVDDEVALRRLLRVHLELGGFDVVAEAADADTSVAVAAAVKPDVVVVDLRLPGADGVTFLRRLRHLAPGCRIIVYTGWADPGARRGALAAGADDYVLKSATLAELVRAMGEVGATRA